jgi:hypothetical protein
MCHWLSRPGPYLVEAHVRVIDLGNGEKGTALISWCLLYNPIVIESREKIQILLEWLNDYQNND